MASNNKPFINALGKTFYWLIINTVFGLSLVFIAIFLDYINTTSNSNFASWDKLLQEGVLLFFCVSISASVMVDYIFTSNSVSFPRWIEFGFYACPLLLLLFSSLVFSQLYFHKGDNYNMEFLKGMQNIIILLTVVYCFFLKTIIFLSGQEKNETT